jgi:hypothetical protein
MTQYPADRENPRPGGPPASSREITARAVRLVWETMAGRTPAVGDITPGRLSPNLIPFAAAKGSLGAVMAALGHWGLADAVGRDEMRRARLSVTRSAMACAAMRRELASILAECAHKNVGVILFKGHDLITACYRGDSIRPVTDADLLVREGDYPALGDVLSSAGYCRTGGETSGVWSRGGLIIDVHLRFVGDMRNPASAYLPHIQTEELFDTSVEREIDGVPYRSPHPAHSLVITALHALTHSYLMDYWFMDAGALLIANSGPSFQGEVVDVAARHRLDAVLKYHLWAIRELFGFPEELPLPTGYRPPAVVRRLIGAAVGRTDYLFFGDVLLGLTIDSSRRRFYYFKTMVLPHPDVIAREMGVDPRKKSVVYLARLMHLVKSGLRVLAGGRR